MSNTRDNWTVVKLKARILVGYLTFFDRKNYIISFSENKFELFWKMNNHLFYCRCFQIFHYFVFPEKST